MLLAERLEEGPGQHPQTWGGLGPTVSVHRNGYGSQSASFSRQLPWPTQVHEASGNKAITVEPSPWMIAAKVAEQYSHDPFQAVFIRAPRLHIHQHISSQQVDSSVPLVLAEYDGAPVALWRSTNSNGFVLGTAFHPELTADLRWHAFFIRAIRQREALK